MTQMHIIQPGKSSGMENGTCVWSMIPDLSNTVSGSGKVKINAPKGQPKRTDFLERCGSVWSLRNIDALTARNFSPLVIERERDQLSLFH